MLPDLHHQIQQTLLSLWTHANRELSTVLLFPTPLHRQHRR
ncbi:hypothetical protein ECP029894212_5074 [Escherichia coli P0298942.12]|nr:hypothetical protein ECP029894212_5074 [Escherichia coli P0298942.12]